MKKIVFAQVFNPKLILSVLFAFCFSFSFSQTIATNNPGEFWESVQFGGGFGLNLGTGYTEITIAPSAIYPLNDYVSVGAGLLGSFARQKDHYLTGIYGISAISLFHPMEKIQLSLEIEQTRVNTEIQMIPNPITQNYWNTGLYVGAGYRSGKVTVGARYNLLFDKDKSIYSDALMPFMRLYF
ncbi:MAG: hypothetical protein RLZZ44_890 [Bacteroidota bacterium]|jgi:long-subunit fatty acid transport protein